MPDLTVTPADSSGPRVMAMAGIKHDDIDLTMVYDFSQGKTAIERPLYR